MLNLFLALLLNKFGQENLKKQKQMQQNTRMKAGWKRLQGLLKKNTRVQPRFLDVINAAKAGDDGMLKHSCTLQTLHATSMQHVRPSITQKFVNVWKLLFFYAINIQLGFQGFISLNIEKLEGTWVVLVSSIGKTLGFNIFIQKETRKKRNFPYSIKLIKFSDFQGKKHYISEELMFS